MQDSGHIMQEQIQQAYRDRKPLSITGGNSKGFYGRPVEGEALRTTVHTGITDYQPTELILTARAGTSMQEIEETLQANQQMLACEAPLFSGQATFGGMIATGLSGPARPYRSSIQDMVLGCTILNGKGEILRFGGKVMKNVAGYDVSRLMAGSLGCLGVILEATVKVVPAPAADFTVVFTVESGKSVALVNDLRKNGLPVSATCGQGEELTVRFSAGEQEIADLPEMLDEHYSFVSWQRHQDDKFWEELKEHRLSFFEKDRPLWRLSAPADADITPLVDSPRDLMAEWAGNLYWLKSEREGREIFNYMESVNGHASLFRTVQEAAPESIFQPLSPALRNWHENLKKAFDPAGILNPGKMYPGF